MLRILLFLPLLGAGVILFLPPRAPGLIRATATLAAVATVVFATVLVLQFDATQTGVQFFETHTWNPRLGTSFSLGLDGLSAPMVLLAALLCLVAVLASGNIRERAKGYYLLLLLLEASLIGVFSARDWSLFYVFWELTLIPLFFLIDRWGGEQRHRAALNFVLYTMGGSVFMLMALLAVYDITNAFSFDMSALQQAARTLPLGIQTLLFVGLFIGFGVKMPIVPLHGWLPLAHIEAPVPVSILLSGILLKMGSYGLLRAAELLPQAMVTASFWLAVIGIVSILYGAVLAWRQHDLKAMIAYSSISHMGIVLFALATLTPAGLTGAVMQMIAHGFTAGLLFLVAGLIYERTHTRDLAAISNLRERSPRLAFLVAIAFLAGLGQPGTAGFVAEMHALLGGLERFGAWIALLGIGMLISAAYALRTVGRLLAGPRQAREPLPALCHAEFTAAALLVIGIITLGVWPSPALNLIQGSITGLVKLFPG
ncbi:MAG: NADH-quinone oxidoreductase subunit M [Gammaproteobacteria bacterium]|nr:NADH-quinone oxidoreductase subunit M [Gammaproteobacteria bacterium]